MSKIKPIEVVISGKKVVYTPKPQDILKLKYYPENPRVHNILSQYKETPSQDQIQKELWDLDSTKDLYKDIEDNKGLMEPIIVKDGFVLEGNSRLCAYRKLYEKAKNNEEKEYWRTIPAIDLPPDVDDKQIFQFLGTCHIRGKAKWRTFEKASYVYRMKNQFGMSVEEIAKDIGMTEAKVEQMIDSYVAMQNEEVRSLEKFSYFMEFFKNRELKKMREEDPLLIKKFANMVKEDKIPRAEKVRELHKILGDKKAKKAYCDQGVDFDTSMKIACRRHPEHESVFLNHLKKTTYELQKVKIPPLIEELKDGSKMNIVKRFIKEVKNFEKNLNL